MTRYKLLPYKVGVKKRNKEDKKENYFPLQSIPAPGGDERFSEVLYKFCRRCEEKMENNKKTLRVENPKYVDGREGVHGIIKVGEYGYTTDFWNVESDEIRENAREKGDSEEIPLFFLYYSTELMEKKGIMIFQRFKNWGGKGLFERAIQEFIKENYPKDPIVKINPIISEDLLEEITSAHRIINLRLLRDKVPRDTAQKLLGTSLEEAEQEIVFKLRRGDTGLKEKFKEFVKNQEEIGYAELRGEKYLPKITLEKKDGQRTLDLGNFEVREKKPLDPSELDLEGGHPTQESTLGFAQEYVNEIIEKYAEEFKP